MITIQHVTKKYGKTIILKDANYTFPQTGLVCLMGASGGGKTTLLNLLAGFDSEYEGEITVGDTPLHHMNDQELCGYRRDNIGFIFQNYHLLTGYTVLENVCLAFDISSISQKENNEIAISLLKRIGIEEKKDQQVQHLSGGQKQRVAIARALMGNPQILFADEPTGALDRTTSTEIMMLLKEIAKDKLVVVITHDAKVCEFADEIIHIKEQKILCENLLSNSNVESNKNRNKSIIVRETPNISLFPRALKNVKVHLTRYIAVSIAISLGLLAFLFSLSFGNVMERSINEFKEKNTAFNNGYIKGNDNGSLLNYLKKDKRIENIYYQYKLTNILITFEEKTQTLDEKFPMPKAGEIFSYGVMPRKGKNEISITPSLAKKFNNNIHDLIGKTVTLEVNEKKYEVTISGIYNAGYDDFFVSSDVEQKFYEHMDDEKNYSTSYDVSDFSNIVGVSNGLTLRGISALTSVDEVSALQNTFASLKKLFVIISILILAIGFFISSVLLFKLQNARYREVGLLSALGFRRQQIGTMIRFENGLISVLATSVNFVLLIGSSLLGKAFGIAMLFNTMQVLLCMISIFAIIMILSGLASRKLLHTEPAVALRK